MLTDLNGDGLDDVIVGAPMWSNFEVMGKYETGRVYVYYQHFSVSKNINQIMAKYFLKTVLYYCEINVSIGTKFENGYS